MTAATGSVVTGIGVVAPNGVGTDLYWDATLAGKSGIGLLTTVDTSGYAVRCGGEATDFDPATWVPSRLRPQTDRWTQFAIAASEMAFADAGIVPDETDGFEMAVYSASSAAGSGFGQTQMQALWSEGPEQVSAYQSIAWFYAATTGQLSIRNGVHGPCGVIVAEQAGGLDVLASSRRAIADGISVALAGGTEAPFCPYNLVCILSDGRLSPVQDPELAYRPFDPAATGAVPGEGGAFMIVESEEAVAARGARSYARIAGHASTFDPRPGADRMPTRSTLRSAIEGALADADLAPGDIDVVFADAAGVPALDRIEAQAISSVFGTGVPVTAPKTMTGRLYGGGAALDVATAALSLHDQCIPPTVGVGGDADPRLALVTESRTARLDAALVLARGHLGFNSALILTR